MRFPCSRLELKLNRSCRDARSAAHRLQELHLRQALGIQSRPVIERVFRHRVGIPQYEVGHLRRVARAEASLLDLPGFFLTGNAFRGIGVNACTADAHRTAEAAATYLHALEELRSHDSSVARRAMLAN